MAEEICNVQRLRNQGLDTYEKIAADPRYVSCVSNIYPLTGKIGNTRKKKKTIGEGAYARINMEEVEKGGLVATKYFTSNQTLCENGTEISTLKYLKGLPNVAQIINVTRKTRNDKNLIYPAPIMARAIGSLYDYNFYTSWDDVFSIIKQVLRGYYTLYTQGIVHRDTKPMNMLITATKEVWITDFGMARYVDDFIPFPTDVYTGTYWYSAPELLLRSLLKKKESVDYFKSDAWAVGVCLYQILTKEILFKGQNEDDIIDYIFRVKGTPEATDGEIFKLYNEYKNKKKYNDIFPKNADAIKLRIENRAKFKPADLTVLSGIIEIVSGLLTYNPDNRMTIAQALEKPVMGGRLPFLPARKSLIPFYINTDPLPVDINERMIDILLSWIMEVLYKRNSFSIVTKGLVLDRSAVYIKMFLSNYRIGGYIKKKNFQLIGCVALHLASCFFDHSGDLIFDIDDIVNVTGKVYTESEVLECIKLFMVGDIQFFGTTYYDFLLKSKPNITPEEKETYALLNYICFQKSLFPKSETDLPKVTEVINEFMNDPTKFGVSNYITDKFKAGEVENENPKVKAFIDAIHNNVTQPEKALLQVNVIPVASEGIAPPGGNEAAETPSNYVVVPASNLVSQGGKRYSRKSQTKKQKKSNQKTKKSTRRSKGKK